MPNNPIDPSIAQAMANAFGSKASQVQQQPSPAPAASADPGVVASLWKALTQGSNQAEAQPVDPYQNFANKATGKDYK